MKTLHTKIVLYSLIIVLITLHLTLVFFTNEKNSYDWSKYAVIFALGRISLIVFKIFGIAYLLKIILFKINIKTNTFELVKLSFFSIAMAFFLPQIIYLGFSSFLILKIYWFYYLFYFLGQLFLIYELKQQFSINYKQGFFIIILIAFILFIIPWIITGQPV